MTKKTLLWHFEKHDFYITKIINEEFYSKSYIREKIEDSDNYFVIDNSSSITNLCFPKKKKEFTWFQKKLLLKIKSSKKYLRRKKKNLKFNFNKKNLNPRKSKRKIRIGKSLNLNDKILRHKFWKNVRISLPIVINPIRRSKILRLQKLYKQIETNKTKNIFIKKTTKEKNKHIVTHFLGINPLFEKNEYNKTKNYNKYSISKLVNFKNNIVSTDKTKIVPLNLLNIKNFNVKIKKLRYARIFLKKARWFRRKHYYVKNKFSQIFRRQYFIFKNNNIIKNRKNIN